MFNVLGLFEAFWSASRANRRELAEMNKFGTNPGSLRMFTYSPPGLRENAPLVTDTSTWHGCWPSSRLGVYICHCEVPSNRLRQANSFPVEGTRRKSVCAHGTRYGHRPFIAQRGLRSMSAMVELNNAIA
jgi:hypothetical protein